MWVFTQYPDRYHDLEGYRQKWQELFDNCGAYEKPWRWILFQLEKGERSGKRHYQGMVCFRKEKGVTFSWLKENFSKTAYLEAVYGNMPRAISYNSKLATRVGPTTIYGLMLPHELKRLSRN